MRKTCLIFSGILFLLGCVSFGTALFFSYAFPKIIEIYLMGKPVSFATSIYYMDTTKFYIVAAAELVLGAVGFFYYQRKAE